MATRLYPSWQGKIASSVVQGGDEFNGVVPAADSLWNLGLADRKMFVLATAAEDLQGGQGSQYAEVDTTGAISLADSLAVTYLSKPLVAQTISGSLLVVHRSREATVSSNWNTQMVARVVSNDGTTVRGTLYVGHSLATNTNEITTTDTVRRFPYSSAAGGVTLSPVVCQEGDRIVIECGFREYNSLTDPNAWAYLNVSVQKFNSAYNPTDPTSSRYSTDLPSTDGATSTADMNCWVEFSSTLEFQPFLIREEAIGTLNNGASVSTQVVPGFSPQATGAGRTVFMFWGGTAGRTVSTVTGCGATWTRLARQVSVSNLVLECWVGRVTDGLNIVDGNFISSDTVTITADAATYHGVAMVALHGVSQVVAPTVSQSNRSVTQPGATTAALPAAVAAVGQMVLSVGVLPTQSSSSYWKRTTQTPLPSWDGVIPRLAHYDGDFRGSFSEGTNLGRVVTVYHHRAQTAGSHSLTTELMLGTAGTYEFPVMTVLVPIGMELVGAL